MSRWRIAGINFDHFHMGDNLRCAAEHPDCEIVGICDERPARMADAARELSIDANRVFTDYRECLERTRPDIVLLCPAAAEHHTWVDRVAPAETHIILEKPFAATLPQVDQIIAAMSATGRTLAVNWPLAWYPCHRTAHRLIVEGAIGDVLEVHFYDGNRGPLWHSADKREKTAAEVEREKPESWFYRRQHGGGSLLDYLGYGTTLGSWFLGGRRPLEVTAVVDESPHLEVDEHAIVVARYDCGLSKFETRWGTFTDPWHHQPQPKCGFVIVGTAGTISSYDYEPQIRLQNSDVPQGHNLKVDVLPPEDQNPVAHLIHSLENERPLAGPISTMLSRLGQEIVDAATRSAAEKRTVALSQAHS